MTIDYTLKLTDILTIAAILIGPITALMIQRFLDQGREADRRKGELFRSVWATRGFPARLQHRHVDALNMVGLDFADKPAVVTAWKEYLDMLNTPEPADEGQKTQFYRDRDGKFIDFIFAMSQTLDYQATRLEVQKQYYSPVAHGTWADQEAILRDGITKLFKEHNPIPIRIVDSNSS
ncbi:DUF6680 family protein [Tunturibacter empetritectus]|uniref:DUF6680 domain-containing protein n=1 Tax=Tunturiibacter lichenicola TaxID=2051959 RepID=A0A7W8J7T6_9BACT|nr:DUF6680 family protein [Edaphobacter lichenicola]MBB5343161.1 hypothetical protein [Edaphobacter lichenicola]